MLHTMRKSGILKTALLALLTFLCGQNGFACSMYKITANGKTMVGNNEDSWRLTSSIWFEQGNSKRYGAAYVGYSDKPHPDGAVNEYGLAFDAFTMPRKANVPRKDPAKKDFSFQDLKAIMQQCRTVEEVQAFLSKLNLGILNGNLISHGGMLLFVDRSGKYLVVEADKLTLGNDSKFALANFSIADTKDLSKVKMERYRKGVAFLENKTGTSIGFCAALSDTMSVHRKKAGDGTLYTTIYDLEEGMIYAYFFHDFSRRIAFDLKQELARGNHAYHFSDLFPGNKGYQQFIRYQTPQNNRLIFGFLVFSGILCFVSCISFMAGFTRSFRRRTAAPSHQKIKLGLALLCLALSYYAYVLIRNQSIFYFPAPYADDSFSIADLTSYLPFVLLACVVPSWIANVRMFRTGAWSKVALRLHAANNVVFLGLIVLYAYWGLYNVWS